MRSSHTARMWRSLRYGPGPRRRRKGLARSALVPVYGSRGLRVGSRHTIPRVCRSGTSLREGEPGGVGRGGKCRHRHRLRSGSQGSGGDGQPRATAAPSRPGQAPEHPPSPVEADRHARPTPRIVLRDPAGARRFRCAGDRRPRGQGRVRFHRQAEPWDSQCVDRRRSGRAADPARDVIRRPPSQAEGARERSWRLARSSWNASWPCRRPR